MIFAALALAHQAQALLRQDLAFTALETELSFWGRGEYQPTADTRAWLESGTRQLLAAAPRHPDYLALRAARLAWEAYWADTAAERARLQGAARETQLAALAARPAYGQGWQKLLQYCGAAGECAPYRQLAQGQLRALQRWH